MVQPRTSPGALFTLLQLYQERDKEMSYQDIEDHIEMMGDPEPLETNSSEIMGCKDIHDGKDYQEQHSGHAYKRKGQGKEGVKGNKC